VKDRVGVLWVLLQHLDAKGLATGHANTMAPFTTIIISNKRHTQWREGHAASGQSARKR
jgi:hypothetical protein